jgi:glycosyltransferase involved in cell wall biosynthesis
VHDIVPGAHLTVVGRKPPARVLELAAQSPLITVTGTVPDVRPFFERAGVVVVPLRIGGGTRLKIYEGMSMGRATVSTTIGAEGLPVRDGEDIVLADAPADMAGAIAALLTDPARAQRIGDAAAVRVREEFSWSAATEVFARHCETIVSRRRGPSPLSAIA